MSNKKLIVFFFITMNFLISISSCSFFQEKYRKMEKKPLPHENKSKYIGLEHYLKTVQKFKKFERIPLIDVEVSLSQWPNISDLINEMDKADVALSGVTSSNKNQITKAVNRFPKRFFPLTEESSENNWRNGKNRLMYSLKNQVKSGALGIGRITFQDKKRHLKKKTNEKDTLRNIVDFTTKMKVPAMIAFHPSDKFLNSIEKNLERKPETKIIWTQIGRIQKPNYLPSYGHGLIRALTIRHSNLLFTITTKEKDLGENDFVSRKNHLFDSHDYFSIDWKNLIEAKISHFMFGVSYKRNKNNFYSEQVSRFRRNILRNFSYPTQKRIAYKNAIKTFLKK